MSGKRKKRKFLSVYTLVDLVGLIGLSLSATYIIFGSRIFEHDSPYLDLWSNLSVEIVSIWIGVRLIDALIGSREKHLRVRTRIVRNLRFFVNHARRLRPRTSRSDLDLFVFELNYTNNMFSTSWKTHLSNDEALDVVNAHEKFETISNLAKEHYDHQYEIGDTFNRLEKIRSNVRTLEIRRIIHRVDHEYYRFLDRYDYDTKLLTDLLALSNREVNSGTLEDHIAQEVGSYFGLIQKICDVRNALNSMITEAEEATRKAEENILEDQEEEIL